MIKVAGVTKRFGEAAVLKSVELDVAAGTVTALIGPSGSGKSTLLRCINLLEVPDEGLVAVGDAEVRCRPGVALDSAAVRRLRRRTGMIFQNFQLFPHRTVIGNVMEGLVTVLRWPKDRARERSMALLDKVGMAGFAEAWPATLSGGQQQRVAIARALAPSPAVLLCDEPTSALDPKLAAEVVDVLRALAGEGVTMLMATHDLRLAATVAREVVFLQGGTVVETGPARTLFSAPRDDRTRAFVAHITEAAGHAGIA